MRPIFLWVTALAGCLLSFASVAWTEPLTVVSEGPAAFPGAEQLVLHSDRLAHDIQIVVNRQQANVLLPGQKFPAIYALDSGYGVAGPEAALLSQTGAMEPALVVNIGYPPKLGAYRNTDLLYNKTPLPDDGPIVGGGGAAFAAFLLEDLRPFIEARFPADPARAVLFGHSFGGLFAANLLAENPQAFAAYVIGSASVWADPAVVRRVADAAPRLRGTRIFLSVGELEDLSFSGTNMTGGFNGLASALKSQSGITLQTHVYAGETHLSYYPRLVGDGFPFVLPPPRPLATAPVKLTAKDLERYAGAYLMPDGRKITIIGNLNGSLTGKVGNSSGAPLLNNGPDRFYVPTSNVTATFDGAGLSLQSGGVTVRAAREKTP